MTARPTTGYSGDLDPAEAHALLSADDTAILVDVRTRGEWRTDGVPDSEALTGTIAFIEWVTADGTPNPQFLDQLTAAGADAERSLVFLCRAGVRSIAAARRAEAAGFGPSYNIVGGFQDAAEIFGRKLPS